MIWESPGIDFLNKFCKSWVVSSFTLFWSKSYGQLREDYLFKVYAHSFVSYINRIRLSLLDNFLNVYSVSYF